MKLNITPRAKIAYGALTFANIALTCLVFWDPIYSRTIFGQWRRGEYLYVNTASLDVHAIFGVAFILAISLQFLLGYLIHIPLATRIHKHLGRALLYGVLPLFVASSIWTIVDRAWSIPPENSVIFKNDVSFFVFYLMTLLAIASYFLIRSARAIRQKDVRQHTDSMVAAISTFAAIVWIRFLYVLYWELIGPTPFTIMGMTQITALLIISLIAGAFAFAGRFRENRWDILGLVAWLLLFSVVLQPFYDFFDPGTF